MEGKEVTVACMATAPRELLERWSPGLCGRAVADHVEPGMWSECDRCHCVAAALLSKLALSPSLGRETSGRPVLPRSAWLLSSEGKASAPTVHTITHALLELVRACPETSVAIALGGGVPALMGLHKRRRLPAPTRDLAATLLAAVASHSEVAPHCLQLGALGCLVRLVATHPTAEVRQAASEASLTLLTPSHALLPLLATGQISPLLALVLAPAHATPEAAAFAEEALPLLRSSVQSGAAGLRAAVRRSAAMPTRPSSLPPSPRAAAATHPPIDGLQLERCLLLARFVDGPKMSAPLLACALSPELGLELACRGGGVTPDTPADITSRRYSDEAVIRAVYLRMASARVLIHVLGERLDDTSYNSTRAAAIDGGGSGGASGGAGGSGGTMPRSAPRSLAMHAARAVLSTLAERLEAESRGEATGKGDEGGEQWASPQLGGIVNAVLEHVTFEALSEVL